MIRDSTVKFRSRKPYAVRMFPLFRGTVAERRIKRLNAIWKLFQLKLRLL